MAHQKHIYDLMKFDSYPRFIRSEHYRRLVEMELTNNYVTENDVTQAYKKGFDSQEDKKRKKSAFKLLKNAVNPIRYRRMSGELKNQKLSLPHESSENPNCYIHFSDGKNITVTLKEGIIVNDLLKDVALYHGVDNQNVDWLLIGENSSEEMTMERDCMVLKDKHIKAEMRVTFRLDILKLQRRIAIRAKTHKPIGETLKPIISKYTPELTMEEIIIRKENSSDLINLDDPVLKLSNQRIIMDTISLSPEPPLKKERNILKTSKKTKKRRESFGPLKRIRTKQSRDHGLMSESNPSSPTKENNKYDSSEYLRYPLARAEPEDITPRSRRSTTFGGQIDTQRGLLNRETLTLPKFLTPDFPPNIDDDDSFNKHRLDNNCSWDGNEDLDGIDGRIPNPEDAYKLFGNAAKGYSNNPCSTNTSYSSSNGTASSIEGSNSNLKQSVLPLPVYQRVMHGHESMEEATSEWEIFSSGSLNRTKHFKDHFYDEAPTYDSLPSLTSQHLLKQCRRTMNPTISKSQSSPANLSKDVGVYHTKITNTVYKKTKSTVV